MRTLSRASDSQSGLRVPTGQTPLARGAYLPVICVFVESCTRISRRRSIKHLETLGFPRIARTLPSSKRYRSGVQSLEGWTSQDFIGSAVPICRDPLPYGLLVGNKGIESVYRLYILYFPIPYQEPASFGNWRVLRQEVSCSYVRTDLGMFRLLVERRL